MISDAQLAKMSTRDLRNRRGEIDVAIDLRTQRDKDELRAKLKSMAADAGIPLAELFGGKKARKKATPKRDPKTGVVWSGHGRRPHNFDIKRAVDA